MKNKHNNHENNVNNEQNTKNTEGKNLPRFLKLHPKLIYLDYQSAKPVDPRVINKMIPYFDGYFGNPNSLHSVGDEATAALANARKTIADFINANSPEEIIFTSGATESLNLAILGYTQRNKRKGKHIIISEVEHISVQNLAKSLEKLGFEVSRVPVDQYGRVIFRKLERRIRDDTILISIQAANNEIGTLQPIEKIGKLAKERNIKFHVDAVAIEGIIPIDVQRDNIDLLSLSSNDLYGPKGVGALYIRKGTRLQTVMIGGGQERGLRSGSENVAGIIGMAEAAKICSEEMKKGVLINKLQNWRDRIIKELLEKIPDSYLNGHPRERLPNNVHLRFDGIEGESILLSFKDENIAVATGSACSSKTLEPSHTLIATGLLHEEAHGSLELTLGRWTKEEDINRIIETTPVIVERLRKMSPLYQS